MIERLAAILLVLKMPEMGLEETVKSLKEIYEYNIDFQFYQLPESTTFRTGQGTVARVSQSPDLIIQD